MLRKENDMNICISKNSVDLFILIFALINIFLNMAGAAIFSDTSENPNTKMLCNILVVVFAIEIGVVVLLFTWVPRL